VIFDAFYVSRNIFNPSLQGPVSVFVATVWGHGKYSLRVYNSAGEHIKTLDDQYLTTPGQFAYTWDGTNKYGQKCASGMYLFYLVKPFKRQLARVLLIW
jgi:flagellar hook assembly protein FlgD